MKTKRSIGSLLTKERDNERHWTKQLEVSRNNTKVCENNLKVIRENIRKLERERLG